MRQKRKLYLVKVKDIKKIYDIVTVFLIDDSMHTFDLDVWDINTSDREWLQFIKTDNSAMECFFTSNIVRVVFDHRAGKDKVMRSDNLSVKPVA